MRLYQSGFTNSSSCLAYLIVHQNSSGPSLEDIAIWLLGHQHDLNLTDAVLLDLLQVHVEPKPLSPSYLPLACSPSHLSPPHHPVLLA